MRDISIDTNTIILSCLVIGLIVVSAYWRFLYKNQTTSSQCLYTSSFSLVFVCVWTVSKSNSFHRWCELLVNSVCRSSLPANCGGCEIWFLEWKPWTVRRLAYCDRNLSPTQLQKLYSDTCVWGLFPGASPAVGRRQKSYKKTTHIDDREEQRFVDQLERKEEKKRKIEK